MSVPVTFAYSVFFVLDKLEVGFVPEEWDYLMSVYALIILLVPAWGMLIYLLVCSLIPKGRKIFNNFRFSQSTELEKFKKEAESKFLSKEELVGINKRLDNIERSLEKLVGGASHAKSEMKKGDRRKSNRGM